MRRAARFLHMPRPSTRTAVYIESACDPTRHKPRAYYSKVVIAAGIASGRFVMRQGVIILRRAVKSAPYQILPPRGPEGMLLHYPMREQCSYFHSAFGRV